MASFRLAFALLIGAATSVISDQWPDSYQVFVSEWNDADNWADNYPPCNGSNQSPVDIDTSSVVRDDALTPFTYRNYDKPVPVVMENDGYTVTVGMDPDSQDKQLLPHVSGGGLPGGAFRARFIDFHWGSNSSQGSEHLIDGEAYPMEAHILHWNTNYQFRGDAQRQPDGLAVLAFLFKISNTDNPNMNDLVSRLSSVPVPGSKSTQFNIVLNDVLLGNRSDFYRYHGSVTIPWCQEAVTWTIFKDPIMISETQLNAFRNLSSKMKDPQTGQNLKMVDNFRPVQALNGRRFTENFFVPTDGNAAATFDINIFSAFSTCAIFAYALSC